MSHNHLPENSEQSKADINLTNKVKNGGQFLDLPVFDYIILSLKLIFLKV